MPSSVEHVLVEVRLPAAGELGQTDAPCWRSSAQLFDWPSVLSLSGSRPQAGFLLFPCAPHESYLRKVEQTSRERAAIRQKQPTRRRASDFFTHHRVILSSPLFVFSGLHVGFLLMALIEGRGYFPMRANGLLLLLRLSARWKPGVGSQIFRMNEADRKYLGQIRP